MARVYLETSFFSACVTTRTDVASLFWRNESLGRMRTQRSRHEVFRRHLTTVCLRLALTPPQIVTPSHLWEADNE